METNNRISFFNVFECVKCQKEGTNKCDSCVHRTEMLVEEVKDKNWQILF